MKSSEERPDGSPVSEELGIELPEDVMDLVDQDAIGTAEEYGFSCSEELVDYVLGRQGYDGILEHEDLERNQEAIDEVLDRDYRHAQGGWYNPENGDQYLMDVDEL